MNRAPFGKTVFYYRGLLQAFLFNPGRKMIALLAIVVGVGIISALYLVAYDIEEQMAWQLRNYGANLIQKPLEQTFPEKDMEQAIEHMDRETLLAYRPAHFVPGLVLLQTLNGGEKPIVVVGTRFDQMKQINPYWKIDGLYPVSSSERSQVLLGARAAEILTLAVGDPIIMEIDGEIGELYVSGIVSSGSEDDNYVYLDLDVLRQFTGEGKVLSAVYYSVISTGLDQAVDVPGLQESEMTPYAKIAGSESSLLGRLRYLMILVAGFILLTTLISLGVTMYNMVVERRGEIALRKCLGGGDAQLVKEFALEGIIYALAGGILGSLVGFLAADVISRSIFDRSVSFHAWTFVFTILISILVVFISSLVPAWQLSRINPVEILKSE